MILHKFFFTPFYYIHTFRLAYGRLQPSITNALLTLSLLSDNVRSGANNHNNFVFISGLDNINLHSINVSNEIKNVYYMVITKESLNINEEDGLEKNNLHVDICYFFKSNRNRMTNYCSIFPCVHCFIINKEIYTKLVLFY